MRDPRRTHNIQLHALCTNLFRNLKACGKGSGGHVFVPLVAQFARSIGQRVGVGVGGWQEGVLTERLALGW